MMHGLKTRYWQRNVTSGTGSQVAEATFHCQHRFPTVEFGKCQQSLIPHAGQNRQVDGLRERNEEGDQLNSVRPRKIG
jgi:hypothetical protein